MGVELLRGGNRLENNVLQKHPFSWHMGGIGITFSPEGCNVLRKTQRKEGSFRSTSRAGRPHQEGEAEGATGAKPEDGKSVRGTSQGRAKFDRIRCAARCEFVGAADCQTIEYHFLPLLSGRRSCFIDEPRPPQSSLASLDSQAKRMLSLFWKYTSHDWRCDNSATGTWPEAIA